MDPVNYMRKQKERVGIEMHRVKDPSVFDFNYIPEQPLLRDECKTLIDAMLRFDANGMATHMAIIGSRGSGTRARDRSKRDWISPMPSSSKTRTGSLAPLMFELPRSRSAT